MNLTGNVLSAASTDLTLAKSQGTVYRAGSNYSIESKNPSVFTQAAIDTSISGDFEYRLSNATSVAFTANINNTQWENPIGTLATVSNNLFTIQYFWSFVGSNNLKAQLGQTEYKTQQAALDAIREDRDWETNYYLLLLMFL